MKNAVFCYSLAVTKGLNVPKRYKGFVPFCFRLNENTIDKTKKLFFIFHYNCEVLLGSLNKSKEANWDKLNNIISLHYQMFCYYCVIM